MILACFRWRGPMPAIVRHLMSFMSHCNCHTTFKYDIFWPTRASTRYLLARVRDRGTTITHRL